MDRICPDCHAVLFNQHFADVALDICPSCAGIWFDEDELRNVMELDADSLPTLDNMIVPDSRISITTGQVRNCPDCAKPLDRFNYMYTSDIALDSCEECGGIWVDDGELRKMQKYREENAAFLASGYTESEDGDASRQGPERGLPLLFAMIRRAAPFAQRRA